MAAIEIAQRTVYRAPTRGKSYLTARSAAKAEATAMIVKKYPSEKPEYDDGYCTYGGWTWTQDDRLVRLNARLVRMILRKMRGNQ